MGNNTMIANIIGLGCAITIREDELKNLICSMLGINDRSEITIYIDEAWKNKFRASVHSVSASDFIKIVKNRESEISWGPTRFYGDDEKAWFVVRLNMSDEQGSVASFALFSKEYDFDSPGVKMLNTLIVDDEEEV